jgi:tetratricopeptide (TPR) repeat protein
VRLLTGHFVGRADELASLEQILDELDRGCPGAIEVAGEPGIGKTRLLRELAARAGARGHLVLSGAASEFENDFPFSVFVDALDEYVAGLEPGRLAVLDDAVQAELAHVFPSLSALAGGRQVSPQHERYRSHRAVRALLEQLARPLPLVLVLDDFHWADSASAELLGALLRRPPAAAVLIAVALRPRQTPERLAITLERAHRSAAVTRVDLGALTLDEARQLLGERFDVARSALLYRESGGNPFYLEQLARSPARAPQFTSAPEISLTGLGVPAAVAASLAEELTLLSDIGRLVLEGAAVAGDPFEPELAAAAAATSEAAGMHAVDELLGLDLIRTTDVPRRFGFRHPLVRRAVYEATAGGWRLGAHERCAEALAERGASAAARAHHVERSARQGDLAAVAVLREAGQATARLAPESAARWFGGALRLLPQTAQAEDRVALLLARSQSLAAAGRFTGSHEAALEAVALVPGQPNALNTTVATACASVERFLGRYEHAHARLVKALRLLPEPASVERAELLIELTLNEFYRSRYEAMRDWATPAASAAKEVGDPDLIAAAAVMPAFADAMTGPTETARSRHAQAAQLVDELSDEELSLRPRRGGLARYRRGLSGPVRRGRRARESCPRTRSRERAGGSLAPALSRPAQGLVRARQAGRGYRAPGRCHRGRAFARVAAGAGREPVQPVRRRTRRRRSGHRARHRAGERRTHPRPRRRFRHGVGRGQARRRPVRDRATEPSHRAAPRPGRW